MRKYSRIYIALIASGAMFQTFSASAAGNGSCTLEMLQGKDKVLENCNLSVKPGTDSINILKSNLTINNSSLSTADSGLYLVDSKLDIGKNSNFSFSGSKDTVGVYLRENSTANLSDTNFTLTGANSHGLRVENGSTASLTNTTLNFSGNSFNSTGLRISDGSQANLTNTTLNLTGNNSSALVLNGSKAGLQNSALHLSGTDAAGAALFNSTANVTNSSFKINSNNSTGIALTNNSKVNVTNSTVVIGDNLCRTRALSLVNSSGNITNSNLTSGSSTPVINLDNSTLDIEKTNLTTGNDDLPAAALQAAKNNTINITDTNITAGRFFESAYSNSTLTLNNSKIDSNSLIFSINNDNNSTISLTANNSTLKGRSELSNATVLNVTLNNSHWNLTENNSFVEHSVNYLTLNNSSVNLAPVKNGSGNEFQTFTILNDLSGTGTFALNTDLASEKSDKIVVKGKDSGDFKLAINDSGTEPQTENGRVTLVETRDETGTAKFSLKDREYVDAGAYRYRLTKDGKNWILSNQQGERVSPPAKPQPQPQPNPPVQPQPQPKPQPMPNPPVQPQPKPQPQPNPPVQPQPQPKPQPMPNPPVQPQPQPKPQPMPNPPVQPQPQPKPQPQPNPPVQPQPQPKPQPMPNPPVQPQPQPKPQPPVDPQLMLSEKTNALVSLRQAQLLQIEQGLAGIHQRLGELKQGENGNVWVRNVNQRTKLDALNTASNSRASGFTQDYHGVQLGADKLITQNVRIGAFIGTANADIDFNGAYSTGKVKSRQAGLYGTLLTDNGFYWDVIYKYDRLSAESGSTGKQSFSAHTVSNEIGKIYRFSNNWTVTPQLQAAFSRISGNNDVERLNSVYARAGLRIAKSFELADWTLQPYAEVNGITSKNSSGQVKVNQYSFDVASAKGRIESALGANIAIGNHRFGIEGKTTHGSNLKQPFVAQAVYRYQW